VLATGHSSPEESLLLIQEAKKRRVDHILVTHAMLAPVGMNVDEMKQAVKLGAFLEFAYNALIGPSRSVEMKQYAEAIRSVGTERCILSSDLGQVGNPLHPDGLEAFFEGLQKHGFRTEQIERMAKQNPARLLGLP
jgi:predicted metal-dependent phosphotriesterase family hydrolase